MKKIYLLFILLFSSVIYSQTNGITYQALILNPEGEHIPGHNNDRAPLVKKQICLRFKIYTDGSALDYQETMVTTTDEFGMVNVVIGTGTQNGGSAQSFDEILWNVFPKSLVVEVDLKGTCTTFTEISNQPFTSVPYALYAANAKSTVVKTSIEPEGENCEEGGVKLEFGFDANNNGLLDTLEIDDTLTKYVCNGANGVDGTDGADGAVGSQGPMGPKGDKGDAGNTGAQGEAGVNGKNTLIKTTVESSGANCTNGGVKLETGLDVNSNGVLDSSEVNTSSTQYVCNGTGNSSGGFTHYIGELYGGGIIVSLWIANGIEHGLIASLTDISTFSRWSNVINKSTGGISFTDGQANTDSIINQEGHTSSAAKLCADYVSGGFDDWYLPSVLELTECYNAYFKVNLALGDINGFQRAIYWSSTEFYMFGGSDTANGFSFDIGTKASPPKSALYYVRAVRRF